MGKLIYSVIMSIDGYIEDEKGKFDWAQPDEEVHTFFNALEGRLGTDLYGRSMYEVMAYWESDENLQGMPPYVQEFARLWRQTDKIVYSRSLPDVVTARTRLERNFDIAAVQALKASAPRDISVGGPNLATHAFRAGLVDECHLVVAPTAVGGGKHALPSDMALRLDLVQHRRFANGMVYLHYDVLPSN